MPGCLREAREVGFSNAAVESHAHFTLHVERRKVGCDPDDCFQDKSRCLRNNICEAESSNSIRAGG